jgi:hypothetical protein
MKFKKTLSAIVASAATVVAFSSHAGAVDQANLISSAINVLQSGYLDNLDSYYDADGAAKTPSGFALTTAEKGQYISTATVTAGGVITVVANKGGGISPALEGMTVVLSPFNCGSLDRDSCVAYTFGTHASVSEWQCAVTTATSVSPVAFTSNNNTVNVFALSNAGFPLKDNCSAPSDTTVA